MNMQIPRYLLAVAVIVNIALLGGSTMDHPPPVAAQEEQTVVELGASHERVNPGECALVEWVVDLAGEWPVTLNDEPVEPHGHREVCPQETTSYTLVVDAPDGPISREARIIVGEGPGHEEVFRGEELPPEGGEFPAYFQIVDPEAIPRGACATLVWEVGDAEEAFVIVNGEVVPPAGNVRICPEETARYELLVEGPEGPQIREIILQVVGAEGEGGPSEGMRPPEEEGMPPKQPREVTVEFSLD